MYSPVVVDKFGDMQPGEEIYGVYDDCGEWGCKCPYGQPGDILWVKETFVKFDRSHWPPKYGYKADIDPEGWGEAELARKELGYKWTPSIFMPREASRLTLEIQDVKCERLHAMGGTDAYQEGVLTVQQFKELWDSINAKPKPRYTTENGRKEIAYYESFPWEDTQVVWSHRGRSWYVHGNPFVWAIKFRMV